MTKHSTREDPRFRELFDNHYRSVYSFFMRRGLSPEDAQDLTQQTFLRLHRGMPTYRGEAEWGFIHRIAANVLRNCIRYEQAGRRRAALGYVEELDFLPSQSESSPEEALLKKELSEFLQAAICRLPIRMRHALELRVYGGLSHFEIGLAMGTTSGAVRTLLHRTREKLRQELGSLRLR